MAKPKARKTSKFSTMALNVLTQSQLLRGLWFLTVGGGISTNLKRSI